MAYRNSIHKVFSRFSSNGVPTGTAFGCMRDLKFLKKKHGYAGIIVAWDKWDDSGNTARDYDFPEYKAQRPKADPNIFRGWPLARQLMTCLGVWQLEKAGIEADDLVYSAAQESSAKGHDVHLLSRDHDYFQTVSDLKRIQLMRDLDAPLLDEKAVTEELKVPVWLVPLLFAMSGDASDNIPGIPGIGPGTAVKLIMESLDTRLERPLSEFIDSNANISQHKEIINRNLGLILPRKVELADCWIQGKYDEPTLISLANQYSFKSIYEHLEDWRIFRG